MSSDGPWLRPEWPAPAKIVAFTTLRGDATSGASLAPFDHFNIGARCGDDPVAVATNRARLIERGAVPQEPRWLDQVHGTGVSRFFGNRADAACEEARADAAVTSDPDVVLAILTADCLPVLFSATDGSEIGAAHAGWRGLAHGVLEHTVAAMRTSPGDLIAWLGPAAGPSAYEIGVEVRDAFVERDRGAEAAFVPTRPGHWHVDLYALARRRLAAVGVQRVFGGDRCTISDPRRFYSHRRDGRSGRMASLIWIDRDARPEPV
jgi:YfiH family protein